MTAFKWIFVALITIHGLIHLFGFVKAFGLAEMSQLTQPISRSLGILWLMAALALIVAAVSLAAAPRMFWMVGLATMVVSQIVIVTSWSDAKFGTVANVIVLLAVAHGFATFGPLSLRAAYERGVEARLSDAASSRSPELVTEADLAPLPEPLQAYIRLTGAVGQPRIRHFEARWSGRIRGGAGEPWMEFTARQVNFVGDDPARFFFMDATKGGIPVDVLHAFEDEGASMQVRLASMIPMISASGPELTRAETVTLFNDISVLAPAALIDPAFRWETIDARRVRGHYTNGPHTVAAELIFNDHGELVNFLSDDRSMASSDGSEFVQTPWSTPLRDYRDFGSRKVCSQGEGRWHPSTGEFTYLEMELIELHVNETSPLGGLSSEPRRT